MQTMIVLLNQLDRLLQFGCGPGRPLSQKSLARIQKLGKGTWCDRKTKDGRTVYYRTDKGKRLQSEGKKKRAALREANKRYKKRIAERKAKGEWIGRTRKAKAEKEKKQVKKLKSKKIKEKKMEKKNKFKRLRDEMTQWMKEYDHQKNKENEKPRLVLKGDMEKDIEILWTWVEMGENYEKIKEYDRKNMNKKILKDFKKVFKEMPIYEGKIYRHIHLDFMSEKQQSDIKRIQNLKEGDEYIFDSYTSFRPQNTFGIGVDRKDIVIYMENKKGRNLTPLIGSLMGEVTLPKGRYRVKKNGIKKLGEINPEFPEKYGKEQEVQAIELEEI